MNFVAQTNSDGHKCRNLLLKLKERAWVSGPAKFPGEIASDEPARSSASDAEKSKLEAEPKVKLVTPRFIACFTVLFSALALTALDYSATGNMMSQIGSDLNGSTTQVEWIGSGYSLAACVMQLPISALSDIFGRKALLIASLSLFFIGSLTSATAQNMSAMIAGRVIQGTGGAGCLVLPEVVLADVVPLRQRSLFYSFSLVVWATFSGFAPMIAGALTDYASWRWFFYMNLFISGASVIATPYAIKLKPQEGSSNPWHMKLREVDSFGGALLVASGVSFLLALSRGGSSSALPWSHWSVILPLVLGAVGFGITSLYEWWRKPKVPMFNIRVFGNLSSTLSMFQNVLQGIINLCTIYYLPTFFQGAKNLNNVGSGASILPLNLVGPPFVLVFGYIIDRTGHYHWINLMMWGFVTAGMGVMTLYSSHYSLGALICMQFLASIGINTLYATLPVTVNATNPPSMWTESTSMMSFFRACGDTLGTAIGGAIMATELRSGLLNLRSEGLEVPDSMNVLTIAEYIKHVDSPNVKAALVDVLSHSVHVVFIVLTIFSAVGLVTTIMQKEYSLNQNAEAKQGIDE